MSVPRPHRSQRRQGDAGAAASPRCSRQGPPPVKVRWSRISTCRPAAAGRAWPCRRRVRRLGRRRDAACRRPRGGRRIPSLRWHKYFEHLGALERSHGRPRNVGTVDPTSRALTSLRAVVTPPTASATSRRSASGLRHRARQPRSGHDAAAKRGKAPAAQRNEEIVERARRSRQGEDAIRWKEDTAEFAGAPRDVEDGQKTCARIGKDSEKELWQRSRTPVPVRAHRSTTSPTSTRSTPCRVHKEPYG